MSKLAKRTITMVPAADAAAERKRLREVVDLADDRGTWSALGTVGLFASLTHAIALVQGEPITFGASWPLVLASSAATLWFGIVWWRKTKAIDELLDDDR